jgi:peptidoglycan/xylan/chitin deacetylase (PgdA/CDA1 family)
MKFFFQTTKNYKRLHGLHFLNLLILSIVLCMVISGCTGQGQEPEAAAFDQEKITPEVTHEPIEQKVTTSALMPAQTPKNTVVPTAPPTLTPLPTASNTAFPTLAPTETAVELPNEISTETAILESSPIEESPIPTKPPPLPTPSGVYSWTLKVPILMYHYISEPPEDADKYRKDLSVTPEDFEEQMTYLAENGFESVDLYDLSLAITSKRELPEKPIVISFDDGYLDNYENAFPIMQKYGMKGTFFVITQFIDESRAGYMTWDHVKEMSKAGMRIESHSKTHPDLSIAEREYIIYEALGSQETIAAHIGYIPRYFCYPSGRYNKETIAILEELDYWGAVTTADGSWHGFNDRFEWPRIRIRNITTLAEFGDMVNPFDTVAGKPSE